MDQQFKKVKHIHTQTETETLHSHSQALVHRQAYVTQKKQEEKQVEKQEEKQEESDAFMLDKLKTVWTMANFQYQNNRIWYFQVEQANATRSLKREHLKATQSAIIAAVEAEYELKINQANATWNLHLQQPQPEAILNLQHEQIEVIQILQHDQAKVIHKLQLEQAEAIHKLHLHQAEATHKFNCKQAKFTHILQSEQANAHIQRMLGKVKNIIVESQPYDQLGLEKLTQEQFNLAIQKISEDEDDEYIDNELVEIVLLLYLTNEIFELDFDLISYAFKLNNSSLKYFEIVFPILKNLSKLVINCEHEYEWSLDLIKLLLSLPNLLCLELKFIPTNIEVKLPEQKLQINELRLYSDSHDETYNMLTIVNMCPNLIKLDLGYNHLNNKYLDKLAETLSQCYNLANLKLSCIHNLSEDAEDEEDKILHFENVISQCPNLIKLEVSSNNIEYKEANNIAKLLSKSTTLFHLNLSGNNIKDKEAEEITKILSQCQTLKELLL
jgi:hypothetical protein